MSEEKGVLLGTFEIEEPKPTLAQQVGSVLFAGFLLLVSVGVIGAGVFLGQWLWLCFLIWHGFGG